LQLFKLSKGPLDVRFAVPPKGKDGDGFAAHGLEINAGVVDIFGLEVKLILICLNCFHINKNLSPFGGRRELVEVETSQIRCHY
jgi:hypothetical protein